MMINTKNYFSEIERIGVDNLHETLRKAHELVVKSTDHGRSWSTYDSNAVIKKVIDEYLRKLNTFLAQRHTSESSPKTTTRSRTKAQSSSGDGGSRSKRAAVKQDNARQVEHLREEVKFIKRFVGLHNKVKSPSAILNFVKALQRAIVQRLIRKTSPLASEIEMIQDKLIKAYKKMKGNESFAINDNDLPRLVALAGGEKVYKSITAIKRFIGLQGKDDETKISQFVRYAERLKLSKDDPYAPKVKALLRMISNRKGRTISVAKAELNGLAGIVKICGCKAGKGSAAKAKATTHPKKSADAFQGFGGVLSAAEMANRKMELLDFSSYWFSVFGRPAKNFTMMFHGEPHNGKTIFLLKLAQFLAEHFGPVLYVSSEEFASPTMTQKVKEFLNPFPERLHFVEHIKHADLSQYQFVILDSVNDLGLTAKEFKQLRQSQPQVAFVMNLQHTKAGDFRGGKDWEHLAEIVGEVNKGVLTITKNRYAPKHTFDFFKQFGIAWREEPQDNESPNDNNDRMMADDGSHLE